MKQRKPLPDDARCLHCGKPAVIRLPGAIFDAKGKVRQEEIPLCAECLAQIEDAE